MIKTKISETTEKYDKDGKLVERITREETIEDDIDYNAPIQGESVTSNWYEAWKPLESYCSTSSKNINKI